MGRGIKQAKAIYASIVIGFWLCAFTTVAHASEVSSPRSESRFEPGQEKQILHLYFSDKMGRYLVAEDRMVLMDKNPAELGIKIVNEILSGPQKDLAPTFAQGSSLRAFFISGKTAYVDLDRKSVENHPGGCRSELLSLFSIVNSLVLNVPEIENVKILTMGSETITFSGHIDLSDPFKADMLLIR